MILRVCAAPLGIAEAAVRAAKEAADHAQAQAQHQALPNTCQGCGRVLSVKQRKCDFCGRPTRL